MKITNVFGLPDAIVKAIVNDSYNAGPCDISCTRLVDSPRKVALEVQHAKDLVEDVSDRIWSLFGQSIHTILERADSTTALKENRLTMTRQNWVISGQFDRFVVADGLLQEYKTTSVFAVKDECRQSWQTQLNVQAHLLREHGYTVNKLQVCAILRDWRRSQADRTQDYPISPVLTIDIPLWTPEKAEEWIDTAVRKHQAARIELPECEDRWETPTTYALMRAGRKTAVRVYDNQIDADNALAAAGPNHELVCRRGRNLRCEQYCSVRDYCSQYQSYA
ncbi:MAG: hypothetical protein HQM09_24970, partial [Candidatus Riflebacteria bacterium]|nr:hypothetical protein [Candidatus Riflebacteria bacterium]